MSSECDTLIHFLHEVWEAHAHVQSGESYEALMVAIDNLVTAHHGPSPVVFGWDNRVAGLIERWTALDEPEAGRT